MENTLTRFNKFDIRIKFINFILGLHIHLIVKINLMLK